MKHKTKFENVLMMIKKKIHLPVPYHIQVWQQTDDNQSKKEAAQEVICEVLANGESGGEINTKHLLDQDEIH